MNTLNKLGYQTNQRTFNDYIKYSLNRQHPFMRFGVMAIWYVGKNFYMPVDLASRASVTIQSLENGSKLLDYECADKIRNTLSEEKSLGNKAKNIDLYAMSNDDDDLFRATIFNNALWVNIHKYRQLNPQQQKEKVMSMGKYMKYYGPAGEIIAPGLAGSFSFWYADKLLKKHYGTGIVGMIRTNKNAQKVAAIFGGGAIAWKLLKKPMEKMCETGLNKSLFDSLFNTTMAKVCTYTDDDKNNEIIEEKKIDTTNTNVTKEMSKR